MRMAGNSLMTRDQRRSAAARQMFMGCSVIITSIGASGAVTASFPEEPRWIDMNIEPSTPPASMSLTRSAMSKQPGRISSNAVGSMPYSSFGRPATALSPTFGMTAPSNVQTSAPSSCRTTLGARSRYLSPM